MSTVLVIFLLIIIYFLYLLFVKGWIWKILVGTFAFIGMYQFLKNYVPEAEKTCISVAGYNFSWTIIIPIVILGLASFYWREE